MTTPQLCTRSDLRPMRATITNRLAARAGTTTEVRADGVRLKPEVTKKDSTTKRSQRSQRGGFGLLPRPRIVRKIRPIDPMPGTSTTIFGISLLLTLNFAHFREERPRLHHVIFAGTPIRRHADTISFCGLGSPAVALTNFCDFYVHGCLPTL
jgi:hypothetical protein